MLVTELMAGIADHVKLLTMYFCNSDSSVYENSFSDLLLQNKTVDLASTSSQFRSKDGMTQLASGLNVLSLRNHRRFHLVKLP